MPAEPPSSCQPPVAGRLGSWRTTFWVRVIGERRQKFLQCHSQSRQNSQCRRMHATNTLVTFIGLFVVSVSLTSSTSSLRNGICLSEDTFLPVLKKDRSSNHFQRAATGKAINRPQFSTAQKQDTLPVVTTGIIIKMTKLPLLGYWDIRGLAQPLRLMLEYADVKFEEKRYSTGPAPEYDKSTWLNEKYSLGMDFPNLPYWFEGDTKLTQSTAIARHIARKHGLDGKNDTEKDRMEVAIEELKDFRQNWSDFCYGGSKDKESEYVAATTKKLAEFDKFLGKNDWFAGKNITLADFLIYDTFDQHRIFQPDILNGLNNLQQFLNRFEQQPRIKEYMQSKEFIKQPLNDRMAYFGA